MKDFKKYLNRLMIIHGTLFVGQIIFAVVLYLQSTKSGLVVEGFLESNFELVVAVVLVGSLIASFVISNQRLRVARNLSNLQDKLRSYQSTMIIKWALMEAASLWALIAFFLTNRMLFLGFSILVIATFGLVRPTKRRLYTELHLSQSDRDLLSNYKP
ncbi:MAG: hypothetical protein JJ975_03565 [Bacteroidia bacterium]|nr:hypothetical protein [Bacteroidia bacterium]